MDNTKQIDFLRSQIKGAIERFSQRRKNNKSKAFYLQMAVTMLSSISTIVLGLNIAGFEEPTRITALVISTIITILSSVDAFFNHKRLWINYVDSLNAMYSLHFDLEYRLLNHAPLSTEELEDFRHRYQAVHNSTNEKWMKLRNEDSQSD